MLGLRLRDEFLGSNMPGTAIELQTDDKKGAVDRGGGYISEITKDNPEKLIDITIIAPHLKYVRELVGAAAFKRFPFHADCGTFAGRRINELLENAVRSLVKLGKKEFNIKRKPVQMYLLILPAWLKGESGFDDNRDELGGYAGAPLNITAEWYQKERRCLLLC
ncbi:MAG: hypothetical protein LBB47_05730 [Spirochaetaceae bacterium]|jgi:hypothetical protein|nr:hypothetical protein [Spirochaetaceae bacterium]